MSCHTGGLSPHHYAVSALFIFVEALTSSGQLQKPPKLEIHLATTSHRVAVETSNFGHICKNTNKTGQVHWALVDPRLSRYLRPFKIYYPHIVIITSRRQLNILSTFWHFWSHTLPTHLNLQTKLLLTKVYATGLFAVFNYNFMIVFFFLKGMSYWYGMVMIMLQISVLKKKIILHLLYQVGVS